MNTTKRQKPGNSLRIVFTALTMGLAAATNAGGFVGPDVAVTYEVRSLGTEQGATQLLQRIEGAAQRICAPLDHGTPNSRNNAKGCRQQVTAAAVSKVNHPMLQAAYDSATGVETPMAKLDR